MDKDKKFSPDEKEKEKMTKDDIRIKNIQYVFDKEKSDFNNILNILLENFKAKNQSCRIRKGKDISMLPCRLYGLVNHLNKEVLKYYEIKIKIVHADRIDATINIRYGNYLDPNEHFKKASQMLVIICIIGIFVIYYITNTFTINYR